MIDIRPHYSPVQPTLKKADGDVSYREFLPTVKLQPFIYCYWELKTNNILPEPFEYRVVADGCIDIFFELDKPEENFVMGFCEKYTQFLLEKEFHYVGIRFLPAVFPQIFNLAAGELSNCSQKLEDVLPRTAAFIAGHFSPEHNAGQIKGLLDRYFLELFSKLEFDADSRLYEAIYIILKNAGAVHMKKDLNTGISPRQLRRLFKFHIGDTPKGFAKVVRFQKMLSSISSPTDLKQSKTFFDAGYYDQPHFIKEFKNFYGLTPGKVFG